MTLFGNISKGFNPPQISQLYIGSSYSGFPNPDLEPEFLVNYEVGARGKLSPVFDYQLSIFRMDFRDQIVAEGERKEALRQSFSGQASPHLCQYG